jgi:hypothetical protein
VQRDPIGLDGGINVFGYVGGRPLVFVDPLGKVKWSGSVTAAGAATKGIGAGFFLYKLTSECKCNKRITIKGYISTLSLGVSAKAYSGSFATQEFHDHQSCPDGSRANGGSAIISAASVFGIGFSCNKMTIGGLFSDWQCGPGYGADVGAALYEGASLVTDVKEECCNDG